MKVPLYEFTHVILCIFTILQQEQQEQQVIKKWYSSDWYKNISHLIGKVKLKFQQDFQNRDTSQTLVELCAIRDGLSSCNALSYLDACELINLISLD